MEEEASATEERNKRKLEEVDARMREVLERVQVLQAFNRLREMPPAPGETHYKYLPIADAVNLDKKTEVSLFAVVSEIGATVHSHGTVLADFTVTLRLVDESRTTAISATFFNEKIDQLPYVKSSGDVINLHFVQINHYEKVSFVKFNKKRSSFALFESKASAECSPYQTSGRYYGSNNDKELLTHMRWWPPRALKDLELQLSSLKCDSTFDLVCKVLHVCEYSGKWIFYVWDGTDTPPTEFQANLDAEPVESPPLLEAPPPREVLHTMPPAGTIFIISSNKFVKEVSHMQNSIYWAKFWNITCKQDFGVWKGIFSDSSGIRLLSHEDGSVVDRLKMYDSRIANNVLR